MFTLVFIIRACIYYLFYIICINLILHRRKKRSNDEVLSSINFCDRYLKLFICCFYASFTCLSTTYRPQRTGNVTENKIWFRKNFLNTFLNTFIFVANNFILRRVLLQKTSKLKFLQIHALSLFFCYFFSLVLLFILAFKPDSYFLTACALFLFIKFYTLYFSFFC